MTNLLKYAFLIIVSLSTSIGVVQAEFHREIFDRAMRLTSKDYQLGGKFVAPAVQAANFLAEELRKERDPKEAKKIADTLIALVSEGEGVGGISDTPANDSERPLMEGALEAVARFLKALDHDNHKFAAAKSPREKSHLDVVSKIMGTAYAGVVDVVDYNAGLQKEITRLQGEELKNDGDRKDYPTLVQEIVDANQDVNEPLKAVKTLTRLLKTTVIPQKAHQLALSIFKMLKKDVDFSAAISGDIIEALIAVETYRMFEIGQGDLDKVDPSLFVYQGAAQSAASEAFLLALVSAIQDILYNPNLTDEELVTGFRYKIPKSGFKVVNVGGETCVAQKLTPRPAGELRPSYAKALELVNRGAIKGLVTQAGLSGRVNRAVLNITRLQKLAIDDVAMRQVLMFYSVPKFGSKASKQPPPLPQFLWHFNSSAYGYQCGFFSLGLQSRDEFINQILDNLNDPKIRGLVNQITSESANIQRAIGYCLKYGNKANGEIEADYLKQRSATIRTGLLSRRTTAKAAVQTGTIKDLPPAAQESTQTMANLSDAALDAMVVADTQSQKANIVKAMKKDLAAREAYLELYAKKMKIKRDQIDMAAFLEQYQKLQADIRPSA